MSNIPNTPTLQNLIVNFIGQNQFTDLLPLFKLINKHEGNIINCKINQYGEHISGYLLIDGHWDVITRLEQSFNSQDFLAKDKNIKIIFTRTNLENTLENILENTLEDSPIKDYLPYKISINNLDEPGILEKICEFMIMQEIELADLSAASYTSEFGGELAQVDIKIKIPDDIHIPSLKEQFDVLCYNENLDASLSPSKIN